ncbi:iron-sulfur cluster repair di-iron protein [Reichenbachiella agarivorans]|uniref:Iron-sulfur cluster repair di-iron protein n=1 Tax=Reichenbachiella agarivorans TaxID=2979464 RepID=A0ABY6CV32_9BACT|nr:iron-sulfur cluster repair di-iron protein [Reichenbachiella agarivorans]UXP33238.1 iron-sulfur cluster repair di-iron protein [Reichenbachiella agarivorans]
MQHKSIESIVNENFVYAKVLDFFGVEFYQSRNKTLEQVCAEYNITVDQLKSVMENKKSNQAIDFLALKNYPIRVVIEYLKHSHQVFIKDSLPFLLKVVNNLDTMTSSELQEDLKLVMPMFVEDFIHHIYEEEDKLFAYVLELDHFVNTKNYASNPLTKYGSFSIQEFALHHHDSDDEMAGIRGITNSYNTQEITHVQLKVLFKELNSFDQRLKDHARIENDILFPRALELEKRTKLLFQSKVNQN